MSYNNNDDTSPIRFNPRRDTEYSREETNTRPSGAPESKKDFKKVLRSDKDQDQQEEVAQSGQKGDDSPVEDTLSKKKGPPSLFDLTSGQVAKYNNAPPPTKTPAMNLMAYQETESKKKKDELETKTDTKSTSSLTEADGKKVSSQNQQKDLLQEDTGDLSQSKTKNTEVKFNPYATEQNDLSYVNPLATNNVAPIAATMKSEKTILPPSNVQEIINQLVKSVQEIKAEGKTDTIITLKHPPMFAESKLIVTSFDSAKNEFNISFENLTQAAKNILDLRVNQQSLLYNLEVRGYNVHILTTTTITQDRPLISAAEQPNQQNPKNQQQPQQQQQNRPRQ